MNNIIKTKFLNDYNPIKNLILKNIQYIEGIYNIIILYCCEYSFKKQIFYYTYMNLINEKIKHTLEIYYTYSKQRRILINPLPNQNIYENWITHYYLKKRLNKNLGIFLEYTQNYSLNGICYSIDYDEHDNNINIDCKCCKRSICNINFREILKLSENKFKDKSKIHKSDFNIQEIKNHLYTNKHFVIFFKNKNIFKLIK